jgi:hypothetical protein
VTPAGEPCRLDLKVHPMADEEKKIVAGRTNPPGRQQPGMPYEGNTGSPVGQR